MVILFAIFGALLAACSVGFAALGIGMLVEGNGAGVVGVVCALPISYGAYLFSRAAVWVRRDLRGHPLSEREGRARHQRVSFFLGYAVCSIVGGVALPMPTVVRVLMVVSVLLVLPLMLAREYEPPKEHKSSGV